MLIGGHIMIQEDGPWAERGPPAITRELTIVGSCGAINSRGGGLPGCFAPEQRRGTLCD